MGECIEWLEESPVFATFEANREYGQVRLAAKQKRIPPSRPTMVFTELHECLLDSKMH